MANRGRQPHFLRIKVMAEDGFLLREAAFDLGDGLLFLVDG